MAMSSCRAEFTRALPRIQLHAQIAFRDVPCGQRRDDCVAEVIALSWAWWSQLHRRGKQPATFVAALARYAARAVRSGRRLCGQERASDVLSSTAQRRKGFTVTPLGHDGNLGGPLMEQALRDNTQTLPDAQAAFRLDFAAWLRTQADRHRRIILELMIGERTADVSRRHGTTEGRISQLRRQYREDWHAFIGEPV
jgi:hypothetical protein